MLSRRTGSISAVASGVDHLRALCTLVSPLLVVFACGGAATEAKPEPEPAADGDAAEKSDAPEPDATKPEAPAGKLDIAALGAKMEEDRKLTAAYAAGELGDRLKEGRFLLVDPTEGGAAMVQYFVYAGEVDPGKDIASLKGEKGDGQAAVAIILLGGEDSDRPAIFRDIDPGVYTACAIASSPDDPEEQRVLAEVSAELEAKPDYKLSAASLKEVAAETERRLGRPMTKPSFDGAEARCASATVSDDPASRIIVLKKD